MTASPEVSRFQMALKGVHIPVPVEQFLLTWHYLFVLSKQKGYVIIHFPSSCTIVRWICP